MKFPGYGNPAPDNRVVRDDSPMEGQPENRVRFDSARHTVSSLILSKCERGFHLARIFAVT